MANYIEYNDKVALHPGYYIQEMVNEKQFTHEELAKGLNLTVTNLNSLLCGERKLSPDVAKNLSQMLGTSVNVWLNIQDKYDKFLQYKENNDV